MRLKYRLMPIENYLYKHVDTENQAFRWKSICRGAATIAVQVLPTFGDGRKHFARPMEPG